MRSRLFVVPSRRRLIRAFVVVSVMLSGFAAVPARAAGGTADPGLSASGIDFTGTRGLVTSVKTAALRAALPGSNARILIVGTGVQRSLFPDALQSVIQGSGTDLVDGHGFGTVAASTILQLVPGATITSMRVPSYDTSYHLLRTDLLADALQHAHANRSRYDLVLLAYPPQAALDPFAHLTAHVGDSRYGRGMSLVIESLLSTPTAVDGTIAGIPSDKALRDRVFARANLRQRDAIERYVSQTKQWNRVSAAVAALDDAGVPIVAPSGDFTRHSGETLLPLHAQTVFGLAAHPSVITVGAAYSDGAKTRLSPTSGRGPTLGLDAKPDLLAPADVMAMLPSNSQLAWGDDSMRVPLQTLQWARAGVTPSTCPSIQGLYKCVLQGSSMVSASVVAANLATAVATGLPHTTSARAATDDEVLRGIAWSVASRTHARAFEADRAAYPWEEGAGVLGGLKGIDPSTLVVPLEPAQLGTVGWNEPGSRTISLWPGGAGGAPSARLESFLGPDQTGATQSLPYANSARLSAANDAGAIVLRAAGGRFQGGFYSGRLTIAPNGGPATTIPASLTQGLPLNFKVSYAYNELLANGIEGERVEDATLVLFSGAPTNVGLIGTAFKNFGGKAFQHTGGDPTNNFYFRYGITKNSFTDASVPASQHGRGVITSVPPGFYRMHLLSDHGVEARQARGREESLGIRLGSFGPDAAYVPGSNVLVGSQPPCDGSGVAGPFRESCTTRSGRNVDPSTGFCTAGNSTTAVAFNVYCGEISYAVPSAVVSRAVHLIEHDPVPARSEWKTCGADIPLDGSSIDFATLAVNADDCEGTTMPTSWSFNSKAPGCLATEEKAAFPTGHPGDVNVTYGGAAAPGLPGRNFPVAVMNYTFKLPSPNTYTTAGMSLSYVADNAIVGLRFQTGTDTLSDASNSLLVVDDPDVSVTPALNRGGTKGSAFNEWSVMSGNATSGRLTIIVIPTAWARTDLDATKPIASVQLCDVALRVNTFGKQSFGRAALENGKPTQFFPVPDRDLINQIDPSMSRVRANYAGGSFNSVGVERESLTLAVQVPKDTTKASGATHKVLSPVGGPAYLVTARRWDGSARQESVLPAAFKANDPGYGTSLMDCKDGAHPGETNTDRIWSAETCRLFKLARANNQLLADMTPQARYNGRFFGNLALDHETLKRAAGDVAFDIADADDGGAFERNGHWAAAPKFEVSNFYDGLLPFPLEPLAGIISIARDAKGNPVLRVNAYSIGGVTHTIASVLK